MLHVMCVDDCVQCVGRDWEVSIYVLYISMEFAQSVWRKSQWNQNIRYLWNTNVDNCICAAV